MLHLFFPASHNGIVNQFCRDDQHSHIHIAINFLYGSVDFVPKDFTPLGIHRVDFTGVTHFNNVLQDFVSDLGRNRTGSDHSN